MILWLISISQLIGIPCIKRTHMELRFIFQKPSERWAEHLSAYASFRHSACSAISVMLCSNLARKPGNAFCSRPLHKVYAWGLRPEPLFQKAVSSTFGCSPKEWDSSPKTGSESKHSPLPASCQGSAPNLWVWTPSSVTGKYNPIWPPHSPLGLLWEANGVA